ncbi:MAG TPA: hypothetical protein VLD37_05675 [Candidatus Bilamarchaeum sp.]|nr:hypothetical protein [Candidatus Bilamarchaeum sp.]
MRIPDLGKLFQKKFPSFQLFRDNLGNFEIFYPNGWKFDEDIAIEDGKYTISFQSGDGRSQFTVAVDAKLPDRFDFAKYAKDELESPTSGIYAPPKKTKFRKMNAYSREFAYLSGGRKYFGGGLMFLSGREVFSLNWTAPESDREFAGKIFSHMLESLVLKEGFSVQNRRLGGGSVEYSGMYR